MPRAKSLWKSIKPPKCPSEMSWGACYLSVEAGGNILVPYGVLITMFHYRRFNRSLVVIHTLKWVTVISTQHLYHYNDVIMSTIASEITSLTIVYSVVYSGADKRKHQSSASLSFVQGIHWGPVNSPHK